MLLAVFGIYKTLEYSANHLTQCNMWRRCWVYLWWGCVESMDKE